MKDERFAGYMQRRFQHLLKLITIFAAADLTLRPTLEHCLLANTVLTEAESRMPSALGEFGESKNASLANKIVNMIEISPALLHLELLVPLYIVTLISLKLSMRYLILCSVLSAYRKLLLKV